MKNMFGDPQKVIKKASLEQKRVHYLEKELEQLKLELEEQRKLFETLYEQRKNTESQNNSEALKKENTSISEEIETNFHEEQIEEFNEPEYIILPRPKPIRQKVLEILQKEAVKEVNSNRREIIKHKIEDELKKKEMSAKELKILFVDEYEYCSKATFYRYLEDLRKEQRIDSIKINGKEYLCSIPLKENKTIF